MSVFGWSYPPGCSGPPEEEYDLYTVELNHEELDFLESVLEDFLSKRGNPDLIPTATTSWRFSVAARLLQMFRSTSYGDRL